jgi:tryptophan-rich sensory protein
MNAALLLGPLVAGGVSGLVSGDFKSVERLKGQPPDWVFGPVWSILYILMGYASMKVYSRTGKVPVIFWVQLALNLIWSPVYVRFRQKKLALAIVVALWAAIVGTIMAFGPEGKFLWPYLAWVSYVVLLLSNNALR